MKPYSNKKQVSCANCEKLFMQYDYLFVRNKNNFCSRECLYSFYRNNPRKHQRKRYMKNHTERAYVIEVDL